MENIQSVFYEFRINEGAIWIENETIQFSIPKKFQNQATKDFIVENKNQIVSILKDNQIFSKEKFLDTEIFRINNLEYYPLSPAQERLWFIEQYEKGTNAYLLYEVYELDAETDVEGVKYALQHIISRHEVLRSTIEQRDNQKNDIQIVHDTPLLMEEIVLSETDNYKDLIIETINRPFNLDKEYPVNIKFYTIKAADKTTLIKTLLLINIHHIASDGWSMDIFQEELRLYYEAYTKGDLTFRLPDLEIQYKDYALWQKTYLTDENLQSQLSYWKEKLSGYQTLELPIDYTRPAKTNYQGASEYFTLNKEVSQKLRELAQEYGATLNSVMLSAMSIVLSKYTNQDDIVIGSPIASRHNMQTQGLIGLFVNTTVNRIVLNKTQNFKELIQQTHQDQIQAQLYQDLPFEKLVDHLGDERDTSKHAVFQVLFAVQSFDNKGEIAENQIKIMSPFDMGDFNEVEKLDISIYINDSEEELKGYMSYSTSLFKKETIEKLARHYVNLTGQLAQDPEKKYTELSLLSSGEYKEIIYDWNATAIENTTSKNVLDLFYDQVVKSPDNIAVVFEEKTLTYQQLDEESNKLANYLIENYDTKKNDFVGIILDRSQNTIISIIGILKTGAAYVCIDPEYPSSRKEHIIQDTSLKVLITQVDYMFELEFYTGDLFAIDVQLDSVTSSVELPKRSIKNDDAAYVIYTSGTTGNPKGVELTHANLNNLCLNIVDAFNIDSTTIASQLISTSFDGSVSEIYPTLIQGGKLYIVPDLIKQNGLLVEYLQLKEISHLTIPADLLESLEYVGLEKLKTIHVGGGVNSVQCLSKWSDGRKLINAYGPTEASVYTTMYKYKSGDLNTKIGKPILNTTSYVLDRNLTPVPVGITGELYIGGAGLAKGYLNRSDLTLERFVPNPFATASDVEKGYTRLYKTGDLVRWLADGNIEYLGRNDDQVKIRGYRIELGEIEAALGAIDGIKQVCVLARERETQTGITKILAGYYVAAAGEVLPETLLLEKLAAVLPDYMVPAILIRLDSFPLTINGKLDKRALPDPDFNSAEAQYVKPETDLEISLCGIYAEVLGLQSDQISTHQNFFKMGGNSILSLQLKQKLNKLHEFAHISIADLFEYNSIQKLIQNSRAEHLPEYKLQEKLGTATDQIAIIGTSGSFSGVSNTQEFWDLIASQQEGLTFNSKEECLLRGVEESVLDLPHYIGVSSDIKDMDQFDPFFWDISPNEARQLSPQIRKFIENSWFVLESSGYSNQRKSHTIGVFAGSGTSDYFQDHVLNGEMADQINMWEASASNSKDALATKTAFFLGLSGPAISINTGCSTGLVSVIEACKNLQLGFCNMALAGGVSLDLPDEVGYVYQEGMILSKDGHCRTFDQQASGTTAGSGVGVVLLKRLSDAVKDGDAILGVIKGYATNNDGDRKTGYTAPSVMGQSECIINAQRMAGISSNEIDYVECHGTATHLGDPIEVQALREAFAFNKDKEKTTDSKTVLGAVKANIGHSDSAAGVASLIKVVLMLENNTIPGQVNYDSPNEELQLEQTNFEILKQNRHWPAHEDKQRLAGISSFGVGGTNAHVIIGDYKADQEEKQENPIKGEDESANYIIPISAKSRKSLELNKAALIDYLKTSHTDANPLSIRNLSYSLQEKREQFNFRSAYCAKSINELVLKLESDSLHTQIDAANTNKTVFMFPGQGAQYYNMARTLYDNDAFFKATLDHCIGLANTCLEVDLAEVLFSQAPGLYDINETQWAQVTLFIVEYSLSQYLDNLGVKADAFIGHSIGEYVAAVLCGIFSLEDAIKIVIARGQLMQSMPSGSMLAIHANEDRVVDIVQQNHCGIAVINSLEDVVVSGSDQAIDSLKTALDIEGIASIKLKTSHAYHSSMMDQVLPEFEKVFNEIRFNAPSGLFVSNVTGEFAGPEVLASAYWCQQLRDTVEFAKGIGSLSLKYNHQVNFIEVGPGKGLCSFVAKYKNLHHYKSIQTTALLPSEKESREQPFGLNREEFRARLWMSGILEKANSLESLAHSKLQGGLPSYQFDFQKCWIEKKKVTKSEDQLTLLPKEKWLSTPVWSAVSNLKVEKIDKYISKRSLVFIREDQMGLFDFKNLFEEIYFVVIDAQYSTINEITDSKIIRLNLENEKHIQDLNLYMKNQGIAFDAIIHCSSIDNTSQLENALNNSFYSLFLIRQYLLKNNSLKKLLVLTNGLAQITNNDFINASNGTLVGAIRNINHEFSNLDAQIIDIGNDFNVLESNVSQVLNKEVYKKSEDLLAFRFGKLWIERLENIPHSISEENTIQNGDVILITGGLGGVALSIAKNIAEKNQVTFILVSRKNIYDEQHPSEYIEDKLKIIEEITASGSLVDIQCFDLSNAHDISILTENVKSTHGSIKGIIHTAGVKPVDVEEYNLTNIKNALKGKVYGIDIILNTIDLSNMKFLAFTSSLSSIMGDVNRLEYCAANSYLDYLIIDKNKFRNIKTVSVNWPGWSDIGMVRENNNNSDESYKPGTEIENLLHSNGVRQEEGAELFKRLINQTSYDQVVVSKLDIHKLRATLFKQNEITFSNKPIKILEDVYSAQEFKIAEIFTNILGLEQISIYDDFFKIGGNSILAIQLSHRISTGLNADVNVADIFRLKSCKVLAENIQILEIASENIQIEF